MSNSVITVYVLVLVLAVHQVAIYKIPVRPPNTPLTFLCLSSKLSCFVIYKYGVIDHCLYCMGGCLAEQIAALKESVRSSEEIAKKKDDEVSITTGLCCV